MTEKYELKASIWKRESTAEWVLEIEGEINDCHFTSRHTELLCTPPQEVAGIPSVYARITELEQTIFNILEGCTLPHHVRKELEKVYYK